MRILLIFALCLSMAMAHWQWDPYNVNDPPFHRRIFRIIFRPAAHRWYRFVIPRRLLFPNRFDEYPRIGYRNPFVDSQQNGYQDSQYDSRFSNPYENQYISSYKEQNENSRRFENLRTNRDRYIPYQPRYILPFRNLYPYLYRNADENQYESSYRNRVWQPYREYQSSAENEIENQNENPNSYKIHIWRPYQSQYQRPYLYHYWNPYLHQLSIKPRPFHVQYLSPNRFNPPINSYRSPVSPYRSAYMNKYLNRYLSYENPSPIGRKWWRAFRSPVYRYQIPINRDLSTGYAVQTINK